MVVDVLKIVVMVVGGAVAGCLGLIMLEALLQLVERLTRRIQRSRRHTSSPAPRPSPRAPLPASPPAPRFAHVLLVEVDENREEIAPVVELATNVELSNKRFRLELLDDDGAVRVRREQSFPSTLTRMRFEPFAPPADATLAETLAWRWDVVLLSSDGERARWREHLSAAGQVDVEAEIMLTPSTPQPEHVRDEAAADVSIDDVVRLLRRAAALARAGEPV